MSAPEPPAPRRARPSARVARRKARATPISCWMRSASRSAATSRPSACGAQPARAAGARISGEWRVHVPRGLAREIVRRSAPREFTQHARNPARSVQIGASHTVFAPLTARRGAPKGGDLLQRANRRRKSLLEAYQ